MRKTVLLAVLALAGCNTPAIYAANPYPPAPPPREEVRPLGPVTEDPVIWQPGHWDWDGSGGYVWTAGLYVPAAGHSGQWLPGYWSNVGSTWVWVRAHWI